jgi:hypothetical protein
MVAFSEHEEFESESIRGAGQRGPCPGLVPHDAQTEPTRVMQDDTLGETFRSHPWHGRPDRPTAGRFRPAEAAWQRGCEARWHVLADPASGARLRNHTPRQAPVMRMMRTKADP